MAYLYGDSSPFPLDENFLETLRDVTEAATGLLRIDGSLAAARERAEEARRESTRELVRIEGLGAQIGRAFEGALGDQEVPHAARVASKALQAARGVLDVARGESTLRRDEVLRRVEREMQEQRALVPKVIESLLSRRQLPGTVWRLRWRATAGESAAHAQVKGTSPGGLEAVLDLDVPAAHTWARAVRVGTLAKACVLHLPHEGGMLRKAGRAPVKLDGWFVTDVEVGPERTAVTLRKSAAGPSEGLELVVRATDGPAPAVRHMQKGGMATGPVVTLEGVDQATADRLWRKIAETMRDLERRRGRLSQAVAFGKPLAAVERPAALAALLVDAVAPLAREIRRRSSASGELSLKRDLGGSRREELFMATAEITSRIDALPPGQRMMFDAFGLDARRLASVSSASPVPEREILAEVTSKDAEKPALPPLPSVESKDLDAVVDALAREVASEDPTEMEAQRKKMVRKTPLGTQPPPIPVLAS